MRPLCIHLRTAFLILSSIAHAADPLDEWQERAPLPTFRELQDFAYDGTRYILLDGDPSGRALVSDDGKSFAWTDLGLPEPLAPRQILSTGDSYLLLAGGRVWHRRDWDSEWTEADKLAGGISEIRSTGGNFWAWRQSGMVQAKDPRQRPTWKNPILYRSDSGRTWEVVTPKVDAQGLMKLHDLLWAKGRFFLAGIAARNGLWSSEDGREWSAIEGMDAEFMTLCEGGGRILAGGYGGTIAVSTDGKSWSTERMPFSSGSMGHEGGSWLTYHACMQLFHFGGKFQALVGDGRSSSLVAESEDGVKWRYSRLFGDPHPGYRESTASSSSGQELTVLVPDEGAATSPPGAGAHARPKPDRRMILGPVSKTRRIGDELYFLGPRGKLSALSGSDPGLRSVLPHAAFDWTSVAASDSRVIVASEGGHVAWSEDAMHFHDELLPEPADVHQAIWVPGLDRFVAVGGGEREGRVWFSSDGETWTTQTITGFTGPATGVAWDGDRLVACGGQGQLAASPDGEAWQSMESSIEASLAAIRWADGSFVATSTEGLILASPDAVTWRSQRAFRHRRGYEGISYGNGVWMLDDRDSQLPTLKSDDLETWWSNPGPSPHGVVHAFGRFIGIDGRRVLSSADGSFWHLHYDSLIRHPTQVFQGARISTARFRDRIVFAGKDGLIGTSGAWKDDFSRWRAEHFDTAELDDPSKSGPSADPDGDGWPNALEYALDFDPKTESLYDNPQAQFDDDLGKYLFSNVSNPDKRVQGCIPIHVPFGSLKTGVSVWPERSTDRIHWTREGLPVVTSYGPRLWINIPEKHGSPQFVRLRWQIVTP